MAPYRIRSTTPSYRDHVGEVRVNKGFVKTVAEMETESSSQSGAESEETSQASGDAKDEEFLPGFASLEAYSKVHKSIFEYTHQSTNLCMFAVCA